MLVSVLSGLARSDVDPWQETAKLTRLPGQTATRELAALIDALPDRALSIPEFHTIATRRIALLPRQSGSSDRPFQIPSNALAATKFQPSRTYVVVMCFVLGADGKPSIADEIGDCCNQF